MFTLNLEKLLLWLIISVTYTAWWKPRRARRCSSCPVWGSGNATGCSSAGISSGNNLWMEKRQMFHQGWMKDVNGPSGGRQTKYWPVTGSYLTLWIRKQMMSARRSVFSLPRQCQTQTTNSESPSWRADSKLTCNKRCSTQGDERVRARAGLQVSHHMFHHSVHCLDQAADHRGGLLLDNDPTETVFSSRLVNANWFVSTFRMVSPLNLKNRSS